MMTLPGNNAACQPLGLDLVVSFLLFRLPSRISSLRSMRNAIFAIGDIGCVVDLVLASEWISGEIETRVFYF